MGHAGVGSMAPKHFRELQCWQLADELRREVIAICANSVVASDRRFCEGFRGAAGSVCRNLSEGFSRFHSGEIVQFFNYALASVAEVQDYLSESVVRKALAQARYDQLFDLSEHVKATATNFMRPHQQKLGRGRPHRARRT
jgi:four helix bundle protein